MWASDKRLVLHVGLFKTGTTTLQNALFSAHSEIFYLGKNNEKGGVLKGCSSHEIYDFLRPMIWETELPLDAEKNQAFLREKIIPEAGPDRVILGSWEGLGNLDVREYAAMLERLYSVFGSFRVIVTVRNPLTWIASLYLQHLRGHFVRKANPWMGESSYIDFDTWLKKMVLYRNSLDEIFSYRANIEAAINLLGRDNVGVFAFENLNSDSPQYYRDILGFIGIDISEGLELTANSHLHRRMTQTQYSKLQGLDRPSIWRKLLLKKGKYRRFVFKSGANDSAPVDFALPSYWEKRISDLTRLDNQWIAETYGLPLGEFGYPH